jgi:hypothetical protein
MEVQQPQALSVFLVSLRSHPVWGQGTPQPMSEAERAERIALLQPLLFR